MIAIIEYNAGNIKSVENALRRLGCESLLTQDEAQIRAAEKVIFPGVGEAASAMKYLKERGLDQLIKSLKQPVLGICLGQQLLCKHSSEGDTECLGVSDAEVKKFPALDIVPHMGWNDLSQCTGDLFKGISPADNFYFVHSYYAEISTGTAAVCDYILPFSAGMRKANFYGTQFHPEKSESAGEKILRNFLAL